MMSWGTRRTGRQVLMLSIRTCCLQGKQDPEPLLLQVNQSDHDDGKDSVPVTCLQEALSVQRSCRSIINTIIDRVGE